MTQPVAKSAAAKALLDRDPLANAALVEAAEYLDAAARQTAAAFEPGVTDEQAHRHCTLAQAYSACAYLLHALHDADQSAASDAAWELYEMSEDGEPLAAWVGDKLAELGLDAGALPEVTS